MSLYKPIKLVKLNFVFSPKLHYMPDGLTFQLYNIFRQKIHGSRRVTRKYSLQNSIKIGGELTEKSAKNMR